MVAGFATAADLRAAPPPPPVTADLPGLVPAGVASHLTTSLSTDGTVPASGNLSPAEPAVNLRLAPAVAAVPASSASGPFGAGFTQPVDAVGSRAAVASQPAVPTAAPRAALVVPAPASAAAYSNAAAVSNPAAAGAAAAPVLNAAVPASNAGAPYAPVLFPEPDILKPAIAFWIRVFSEWSENQYVVHAMDDLSRIYTVIDLSAEAQTLPIAEYNRVRHARQDMAIAHVQDELRQLEAHGGNADGLDEDAHRILAMFGPNPSVQALHEAQFQIRVQRGMRERTRTAIEQAGLYLPEMERIFQSYGLPVQLTRLPLIESSFNVEAYSKDRAAGIWQFIPAAARTYMHVSRVADDRRDPWASTDAAARHLKDDYNSLMDWPLAVTAYNYGRSGLVRALQEVGGTTLEDLLRHFSSARFGFASRNYYAEFVAAEHVDRDADRYFPGVHRQDAIRFEEVTTQDYVPFSTLVRLSGTDVEEFHEMNPAFDSSVLSGKLFVPPETSIRVPYGHAASFRTAYAQLGDHERFEHQRVLWTVYRVRRGDSLLRVSARLGVSTQQLLAANHFRHRLRPGSTLRVPAQNDSMVVEAKMESNPSKPAKAVAVAVALHHTITKAKAVHVSVLHSYRVRTGDTLAAIADRLDTSVHRLCALNGLRTRSILRPGMSLKIPLR